MFHAIKISKLDQNTHRSLWRNLNLDKEPDDYVMASVSCGDTPFSSIAIMALKKTAELGKMQYPEAVKFLQKSMYMDDIIDSFSNYLKALDIIQGINEMLRMGNFEV